MTQKEKSQQGFAHVLELIVIAVVIVAIAAVFKLVKHRSQRPVNGVAPTAVTDFKSANTPPPAQEVSWHLTAEKSWEASSTPPPCPSQPVFVSPVDLLLVSSILYPGQVRGTAFKPHGGFRFDNQPGNDITVKVPMDAKLVRGSKGLFPENGEVQYGFEFIAPCGIWYAFGHIHTLSPQFQAYADKLPLITEISQQQLYDISGSPSVKAGDIIATQVGITHSQNVFVEWQVNDLRQKNGKIIRPAWAKYADEFDQYGVCWLDMLPASDAAKARALPGGDSVSGKQSDYC